MVPKIPNVSDVTAGTGWHPRDLLARIRRRLRLNAALRSYQALTDAQLEDIGLTRADLEAAARDRPRLPRHLSDAYMRRQPFTGFVRRRIG